jgi:hypothetical protein
MHVTVIAQELIDIVPVLVKALIAYLSNRSMLQIKHIKVISVLGFFIVVV